IGRSEAMYNVLKQVEMVAQSDSTVLILGETGTGKELIARAIHRMQKTPAAEIAPRVTDALRMVQLEEFAQRKPHQLSGGQQQRV
ncbi:sigma 54-interacting transcriptional regulator, partial [Salmonella enterica subsp. enterica serovar Montevideo]|nr:sigma 54-interacting transcriptional regulator [Salmonella enterica subsp. enterica serovar Montevideo]